MPFATSCRNWLHQVVHETGENAGRLGGVEVGDFVAPACAADLFERRIEAAGDELFVEAWGPSRLGRMRSRRGRRPYNGVAADCGAGVSPALVALRHPKIIGSCGRDARTTIGFTYFWSVVAASIPACLRALVRKLEACGYKDRRDVAFGRDTRTTMSDSSSWHQAEPA